MVAIRDAIALGENQLTPVTEVPRLEAELLLAHALDKPRSYLFTWPEEDLAAHTMGRYAGLVSARSEGRPIAYLTGEREFWSLTIKVNAATLIPRPDTETLVEQALQRIPDDADWAILDLGTGSGAIALAIASERPRCRITATDISPAALETARENSDQLGLSNITFLESRWFDAVAGQRFELIVSNPPYIPDADPHLSQGDVRFEPRSALASGADGLDDIRAIIAGAPAHLKAGGWLLLEHGYDQSTAVQELLNQHDFSAVFTAKDLGERGRVSGGQYISTR